MRVCILGSGLSALTLAKALVNENIFVDLISLNQNHKINKSRTIGISKTNFQYFNQNIINIANITWELKKIEIFTDNLKDEKILNFQNKNDQLFSILKNYKLYELLGKSLSNNKYYNKIKFEKKSLERNKYKLIINTEYNNSFTKKFFNKKILKTYNSFAFSTIIKHEKISNIIATQIFTKQGPLAFLPVSPTETSVVYSIYNSKNNKIENIKDLINKYNSKYKIKKIENIESFELKCLNLRSYYHENILAFGELLHKIHPLAGQGFNMTIRDIIILLQIIKNKISLGLELDKSVNIEFQKKLRHKNLIFSTGIDLIHEIFNFERKVKSGLLSKSIQILGKNPSINNIFTKIADEGTTL